MHFGTGLVLALGPTLVPVLALGHSHPKNGTRLLGLYLGFGLDKKTSQLLNRVPCSKNGHSILAQCHFMDMMDPMPELVPMRVPVPELGWCQNEVQHIYIYF